MLGRREAALELAAAGVAPLAHRCSWTELMDLEQRYYDCGFLQHYKSSYWSGEGFERNADKVQHDPAEGEGGGGCALLLKVKSGQVA